MKLIKSLQNLINHELILHSWTILSEIKSKKDVVEISLLENEIQKQFVAIPYELPKGTDFYWRSIELQIPAENVYCVTTDKKVVIPLHLCGSGKDEPIVGLMCMFNVHAKEDGFVIFTIGNKSSMVQIPNEDFKDILKRQK